eukprot:jgi/Ulvmu1/10666/UM066_0050.1
MQRTHKPTTEAAANSGLHTSRVIRSFAFWTLGQRHAVTNCTVQQAEKTAACSIAEKWASVAKECRGTPGVHGEWEWGVVLVGPSVGASDYATDMQQWLRAPRCKWTYSSAVPKNCLIWHAPGFTASSPHLGKDLATVSQSSWQSDQQTGSYARVSS